MAVDYSKFGHIRSQYRLGDIQKDYLFAVRFKLPKGLQDLGIDSLDGEFGEGFNQLTMTCREAPIVGMQNSPIESNWFGMVQYFAGKSLPSSTSVSFTFEQFEAVAQRVDAETGFPADDTKYLLSPRQIFQAWSALAHNTHKTGIGAEKKLYISDVEVIPLRSNLTKSPMGSQILRSAWVEGYGDMNLSSSGSSALTNQVTFKFDYFDINMDDVEIQFQNVVDTMKKLQLTYHS